VSEGRLDMGMTGITIREDRAEVVDFLQIVKMTARKWLVRVTKTGSWMPRLCSRR
jgi:polar amino acid transport system substrate-binding protein